MLRIKVIHKPMWGEDGVRKVGIAIGKYNDDDEIKVIIDYRVKSGELLYPNPFMTSVKQLKDINDTQIVGENTLVHKIAIASMKEIKDEDESQLKLF